MNFIKVVAVLALGMNLVTCCSQKQEARKPISHSSGEFMKQSVERNKKLNDTEEKLIENVIKKDTASHYIASTKGYWYSYEVQNNNEIITPKKGDIAIFDYEFKDLDGNIIYSKEELKPQKYYVDKQDMIIGLRDGIKLMKKGETITFLFPSHMAFGYHGDNNKVGTNKPLICTVTLNDIKKDTSVKTEKLDNNK